MKKWKKWNGHNYVLEGVNEYRNIFNLRDLDIEPPKNYLNTSSIKKIKIETSNSIYEFEVLS